MMLPIIAAPRSRRRKTCIAWRKRIRRLRITDGRKIWQLDNREIGKLKGAAWVFNAITRLPNYKIRKFRSLRKRKVDRAQTSSIRTVQEHRHHGPHRCREDHYDGAHPFLYGKNAPHRRGP